MYRLKVYFSYDGTGFEGFQRQSRTTYTIQENLERVLSRVANQPIVVVASGRTDSGVHARVQVAHCNFPGSVFDRLKEERLLQAFNSLLPRSIRILKIEKTVESFHAIINAKKKTYLYFIDPSPVQFPWMRNYAWHLRLPLNWNAVEKATQCLVGKHDFKSFCGSGSKVKTTVRTIEEAYWGETAILPWPGMRHLKVFKITGQGFLKQMVRNIVGTLIHIGNGKMPSEKMAEVLASRDRRNAGPTAPAHGLWLWDIQYNSQD